MASTSKFEQEQENDRELNDDELDDTIHQLMTEIFQMMIIIMRIFMLVALNFQLAGFHHQHQVTLPPILIYSLKGI